MSIDCRVARPDDKAEWVRLRSVLWPTCSVERHQLEVEQLLVGEGIVILALADGKMIGFAEVSIRNDHVEGTTAAPVPYLEGWYVDDAFRHRGVGRALLAFVENWSLQNGYSELASDAELENDPSVKVHAKVGFREVGRSVHFVKTLDSSRSFPGEQHSTSARERP